jgi:hypothetical protein
MLLTVLLPIGAIAQNPEIEVYQARVVMKTGSRFRGTLADVTDESIYLTNERGRHYSDQIPLALVRKVVIRRLSKKNVLITGASIGGLVTGYLSYQSLQKNQTRSPVTYGLTLTFAIAGGAALGLLLSSTIGNITSKVIRPLDPISPETSLFRQLEPFSIRYQQELFNRLPQRN